MEKAKNGKFAKSGGGGGHCGPPFGHADNILTVYIWEDVLVARPLGLAGGIPASDG